MSTRTWTKWVDQRTPYDARQYRFRIATNVLGLDMVVQWTEKQTLCGMGFSEPEYWPVYAAHWNGYSRSIIDHRIEWSEHDDTDSAKPEYLGLDLLPCPFTGKPPAVVGHEQWIGAPPFLLEWMGIRSHLVDSLGWRDAKAMREAWNTRFQANP